jgi:hypothetical protein
MPRLARLAAIMAVLSLTLGNGLRFYQVGHFMEQHLHQRPIILNPDQREVCFLDVGRGFYKWDLVQNDPFLRGNRLYLISHGAEDDAALMARLFPGSRIRGTYSGDTVWALEQEKTAQ